MIISALSLQSNTLPPYTCALVLDKRLSFHASDLAHLRAPATLSARPDSRPGFVFQLLRSCSNLVSLRLSVRLRPPLPPCPGFVQPCTANPAFASSFSFQNKCAIAKNLLTTLCWCLPSRIALECQIADMLQMPSSRGIMKAVGQPCGCQPAAGARYASNVSGNFKCP